MKRASRKRHPSILEVPPAFLYYSHSSANAAARNASQQRKSQGGTAGQRERSPYEATGGQTHRQGDGPDAARHSENVRPGRVRRAAPNQQRLSPTEIHSSREAGEGSPGDRSEIQDGRRPVVPR